MSNYDVAFFDVDETIVTFKTMFSFLEFFLTEKYNDEGKSFRRYYSNVKKQWANNTPREIINMEYYKNFKNTTEVEIKESVFKWFRRLKENKKDIFYNYIYNLIYKFKENNIKIVLVSGSLKQIVEPIAKIVQADKILATNMFSHKGLYTGEIIPPQTIGLGKRDVVINYIKENNINVTRTIAYGDHTSDFSMLSAAGKGVVYTDNAEIMQQGIENGFMLLDKRIFQ